MKKHLYSKKLLVFLSAVLALLVVLPGRSWAQTSVCSFQPGAHFTRAGSPYTLTCGYVIPVGDSLVVDAGVRLNLGGNGLYVNGKLRLHGSQQDSVFVTGSGYEGIRFSSTGSGAIAYTSYRNTATSNSTSVFVDGTSPVRLPPITNCHFYSRAGSNVVDIATSLAATVGFRELVARSIKVSGSGGGQSGRLRYCGPNGVYQTVSLGNITLNQTDSLVLDAGVRLVLDNSNINIRGKFNCRGTQRDSVYIVCNAYLSGIRFMNTGTGSLSYVSVRHLDTTIGGGTSLTLEEGVPTRAVPTIANCRFTSYASARTTDISLALNTTTGLRNSVAQRLYVPMSNGGQSGRLRYCGPKAVYQLERVTLNSTDSLVVDAGVRIGMSGSSVGGNRITVNGKLYMRGTPQDSIFVTSANIFNGIQFLATGRGSLSYVSYRNTDAGTISFILDRDIPAQTAPSITNCRFTIPAGGVDMAASLVTLRNFRNNVVRQVQLQGGTGQSGQLLRYGATTTYRFDGNITLTNADSLVVAPGVRLDLLGNELIVNGRLRMQGTPSDSVFVYSSSRNFSYFSNIRFSGTGTGKLAYVSYRNTAGSTALIIQNGIGQSIRNSYFSDDYGFTIDIPANQTLYLDQLKFGGFQTAIAVSSGNVIVANSIFNGLKPKYGINAYNNSSVSAVNCTFGHPSGPYNAARNPAGLGCQISNNVCLSTGVLPVAGFEFAIDGNNVAFVNTSISATGYTWNFGNNTTSTLANPLKTLPAGTYTVCLTARAGGNLGCVAPSVCKTVSIKGIASITTDHGGNTGAVSVVVRGGGFQPGMQLFLRRTGSANIVGDTVITRSVGELTTSFDLTGKALGKWDVVVVYPNGSSASLPNGFTVEAGTAPNLWVNLSGSSVLRIGFRQVYTVSFGNTGNTDAVLVPLLIEGLPKGTVIELLDSTFQVNKVPGHNHLNAYPYDSVKLTNFDSVSNYVFRILYIKRIAANSTNTLSFVFRLPFSNSLLNTSTDISAHLYDPIFSSLDGLHRSNATSDVAECGLAALKAGLAFADLILPISEAKKCGEGVVSGGMELFKHYVTGEKTSPLDQGFQAWDGVSTLKNCVEAGAGIIFPEAKIAKTLAKEASLLRDAIDAHQAAGDIASNLGQAGVACGKAYRKHHENKMRTPIRGASDPNAKYGPGGGSVHHYTNKDNPLGYSIGFENLPTATADAQTVRVTDTLSTQAFDLKTFAFTSVTIGTSTYALPAPAKSFVHDFDFVAQHSVKARVVGTFDATTGIVRWTIFSIDPATNQTTTNALLGFLPPDIVSPLGQGYVSFIVNANPARQTGDVIRNRASIVFDYNPAIITNYWHNTFDLVPPSSSVTAVTATAADSVVQVSWAGTDVGSAIQSYDILYSKDGENPLTWLSSTSTTSGLFTGQPGATYCFYSIARDSANNVEARPLTPDACQQLQASAQDPLTIYPNPTKGSFTLEANALQAGASGIDVLDIVGRLVYHQDITLKAGVQATQLNIGDRAPGLYFVRVKIDGKMAVKKLVKL